MRAQSSCSADLPSLCARSLWRAGRGRQRWQDLAWLCGLAGFGSAGGTQEAGGGSGEGLGVPAVGAGLHADPSLQKSFVSAWTGMWLHIPSQSSRDVSFQKGGLPCGFMSVILGFKLFMHEKLLRSCILPCMNNDYMGTQITAVLH